MNQNKMDSQIYGPVLLVCIYNKFGNIITHDYFYQLFSQYGEIVKILIFQKAKVWKTFIEFTTHHAAKIALQNLNNHVVFEDGSKMNIFPSKLRHIKLQNANLGGVNYEQLKNSQHAMDQQEPEGMRCYRRSTYQQHKYNDHKEPLAQSHEYHSCYGMEKDSAGEIQSTFSLESYSNRKSQKSFNTFDIDEQFLQLARESQQFRMLELQEHNIRSSNRRKSKTIVTNPNLQQFLLENNPSKVIFVRSIPHNFTNKCLYNIFANFGNVLRVIYMRDKGSGLIEFQTVQNAICAKDELNYAKADIKVFYSHYQTLSLRKEIQGEQLQQYNKCLKFKQNNINPPSQILYLTMAIPSQEEEIRTQFEKIGCPIYKMDWRENGKDRWMCLADLRSIEKSLTAIGFLQGLPLRNRKELKLSFTRSKMSNMKTYCSNNQIFQKSSQ